MNPYDDHYIINIEVVAKVSVGFSVPSGTSLEAVDSIAMDTVDSLDAKDLIDNIYDIDTVSFIGVEQD